MNKSKDLWFVSFLLLEGIHYNDLKKNNGKAIFYFDIGDADWFSYKQKFYDSYASKLKWQMEKIKDLMH